MYGSENAPKPLVEDAEDAGQASVGSPWAAGGGSGTKCLATMASLAPSHYDFEYVVIAPPEAKCPWAPERRRHQ